MADDLTQTPEAKASHLGWVPQEQWRGEPENWVDAGEFLRRGEHIMPILRKNNEQLQMTVGRLEQQLAALQGQVAASQDSMVAMEELHKKDLQRQVARAKEEIKAGLRQAREAGDTDNEVLLLDQLTEVNGQLKDLAAAEAAPKPAAVPPVPQLDAATTAWMAENTWFQKDKRRTLMAIAIAEEFAQAGRRPSIEYYRDVDAELAKIFGDGNTRREAPDKVSGGRGEATGGASRKGYGALPADAKAECDKDAARFVGEGRRFKDAAAYQAYYAKLYFSEE